MDGYSVLWSLSLRMTIIILCVLAIKTVFKTKLSPKIHTAMWVIVCVQFVFCICNVRIQNSASIYNVMPDISYVNSAIYTAEPAAKTFKITDLLVWIWLGGSAAVTAWYIVTFIKYRMKIRKYPVNNTFETRNMMSEIKALLDIPQSERIIVRLGDTAQTMPHTVIMPEGFSESEKYQIMLHEMCHYRHKDYIKLWIGLVMLCLNWFNPLVWIAFRIFRTDLEMLCDDRVLHVTNDKKEYAQVLVKSAMVRNRFVPGAASVHNGKHEIVRRVKRIASLKRYKPVWMFICCFVCVTACCVFLTDSVSIAVENTIDDIVPIPTPASIAQRETPAETPPAVSADIQTTNAASQNNKQEQNDNYTYRDNESGSRTQTESSYNSETRKADIPRETSAADETVPAETGIKSDENITSSEKTDVPEIGSDRDDVYSSMGEPESVSGNGNKETYQLEDGKTAVLQYSGDTLENGYIIY